MAENIVSGKDIKNVDWDQVAKEQVIKSAGVWRFLAKGENRIRLVVPKGREPRHFYEPVDNWYKGELGTKFMVFAVISKLGEADVEVLPDVIYPVIIPKSAKDQMLEDVLKEGYDILSVDEGHGVKITRASSKYRVIASREPVPLTEMYDDLVWPEKSIEELAVAYSASSKQRNGPRSVDSAPDKAHSDVGAETGSGW